MATSDGSAIQRAQSQLNQSSLQCSGGSYLGQVAWPNYQPWIQYYPYSTVATEEYANVIEIETGEHDATIKFYRQRDRSKSLVRTVTVPLSLLELLAPKGRKR